LQPSFNLRIFLSILGGSSTLALLQRSFAQPKLSLFVASPQSTPNKILVFAIDMRF